jgi:hypothetical protein
MRIKINKKIIFFTLLLISVNIFVFPKKVSVYDACSKNKRYLTMADPEAQDIMEALNDGLKKAKDCLPKSFTF